MATERRTLRGQEDIPSDARGRAPLQFKTWRITGGGDLWIVENLMSVAGGDPQLTISFQEWRGDKVAREVVYITQPFEAAPERSRLAQRFEIPPL